jgi:hypothetical protein
MKFYLEKSNPHYFTSYPNSELPVKAVIRHLPPDTWTEDISDSLEVLGFNVINVRQMTDTRIAQYKDIHLETLALFLVIVRSNTKSQEIFKLNSLNHITI